MTMKSIQIEQEMKTDHYWAFNERNVSFRNTIHLLKQLTLLHQQSLTASVFIYHKSLRRRYLHKHIIDIITVNFIKIAIELQLHYTFNIISDN